METFTALYTTRAMRRMKPEPIPADAVARIIDAGLHAPCGPWSETQSWRFVAVSNRQTMKELGDLWRASRQNVQRAQTLYSTPKQASSANYLAEHFDETPLVILGFGDPTTGPSSVGLAMWSMCLAARALGIGSTYTKVLCAAQEGVAKAIGKPADDGLALIAALPMGYPLGRWGIGRRQPAHEVTFAEGWGEPVAWEAAEPSLEEVAA
jgi:nitroreductase